MAWGRRRRRGQRGGGGWLRWFYTSSSSRFLRLVRALVSLVSLVATHLGGDRVACAGFFIRGRRCLEKRYSRELLSGVQLHWRPFAVCFVYSIIVGLFVESGENKNKKNKKKCGKVDVLQ